MQQEPDFPDDADFNEDTNRPSKAVALQTAQQTTPQAVVPPMTVQILLMAVDDANKRLQTHAAAYAALMRAIDDAGKCDPNTDEPPLLTWVARLNDKPVEICTDLSELDPADIGVVLVPLANLHENAMKEATCALQDASSQLDKLISDRWHHESMQDPA